MITSTIVNSSPPSSPSNTRSYRTDQVSHENEHGGDGKAAGRETDVGEVSWLGEVGMGGVSAVVPGVTETSGVAVAIFGTGGTSVS